ncbi:inverse autotransporter beta domain-containing protein [Xenorhabdus sp. XENO-10]|uniref:Inverse autotransporter beta domain-containing protein n=1 Tax=Xenorhabdus yunnanensis TaxID=3025878 RepID=A0ABT5LII5_9GAMM|nr:inverse autotransporter beta domain-containing protein [Xenorhabdus yunnanensis]MDC9590921.1 inverse autotransporter beta domain-containing protein [Xenorhabdus yunnanensis]
MLKEQSRQWTDKQRHWIKLVVWANIFAQIAFPIAGAFTPLLVIAQIPTVAQEAPSLDQPFMQQGKKNVTDDPKSLSGQLLAGQLLAGQLLAENLRQSSATEFPENNTERWLARAASRAAGMLKNGNIVDSVKSQLHGLAVNEANQAVQNWLRRYGTVKLQANMDKRGRLEGSQFDMLLPLYDSEQQMAFTQFGLRRIDHRTTANFGLGQRHFLDTGMFGYNAFLDHDITRDHTRFGIGAEYARDFMKFGANGYFRASGWKDDKKLKDYEERPASGFDLRAEGYMPDYPQLGGKLIYEQYFGNEVGLLSEERRQKNPSVFTVGANYTPIPLVKLGIDRKQSAQGHGETLFNFGLSYELGAPWSKQIDPDAVAFKRGLHGGRYDLVERNNQIVLEYRKKELILLTMEKQLSGYGEEVIPLNVNVIAKYGLKEIVWDTTNLEAGGGKFKLEKRDTPTENMIAYSVREGTRYLLALPPYHAKGNNTYTLSGIAYDNQGNVSERAETQIQVIALAIGLKGSGFELAKQSMLADGKTQTVLRLKLIDKDGKPIRGAVSHITFTSDLSGLKGIGQDPELAIEINEVTGEGGVYEVVATAGTKQGQWGIKATVDGHELPSATIDFYSSFAEIVDTDKSRFKLSKEGRIEPNESGFFQLDLRDKHGHIIAGVGDYLTLELDGNELYGNGQKPTLGKVEEIPLGSGHYEWHFKGKETEGRLSVTSKINGQKIKTINVIFGNLLTDIISETHSTFSANPDTLEADNQQQATLTLVLKDSQNQPIANVQPHLRLMGIALPGNGDDPKIGAIQETLAGSGTYTATVIAGTKTGDWTVTPQVDSKLLTKIAAKMTFNSPVPTIKDLELKVDNPDMFLVVGRTLQVDYKYENNGGNKEDNSFYAWGEQGQTIAAVKDLANSGGSKADSSLQNNNEGVLKGVVNNGKPQGYPIVEEHAGKVLEFSILARNGLDARAKDILTLTTNDPQNKGNHIKSKIGGGRVANVADALEVKLDAQGKDTAIVYGKPVVKLKARENNFPNSGGDSIKLTIKITKSGKPVAWVPLAIKMSGFDRRNWSLFPGDFKTMLDGKEGDYIDYTDQTGELVKTISDPNGIGARTTLKVVVEGVTGPIEKKIDVIFTVITSPDVPVADYWGHMKDVVHLNGINYHRPLLHKEWSGATNYGWGNHEAWAATLVSQAQQRCNNKLPTVSELQELSKLPLYNEYGWPVNQRFTVWSNEPVSGVADRWFGVDLHNGRKDRHQTSVDEYSSLCKE